MVSQFFGSKWQVIRAMHMKFGMEVCHVWIMVCTTKVYFQSGKSWFLSSSSYPQLRNLPCHIITVHQLFSLPCEPTYHANKFTFTVHWFLLTDCVWVFSKFAGKLQFIHICFGVRSDYKILVFWKLNISVIGITILHIPFSHDIIFGFRCFVIEI